MLSYGSPCLSADPPLTESEQRETLANLEELIILRQENAQLREIVAKDSQALTSLQAEVAALRQAQTAADRVIAMQDKLAEIQNKAMLAYKELAAAERLHAERAEEKLKTAEKWTLAGWIGTAVGIAAIVGSVMAK